MAHYFWRRWPALDEVTSRREQWLFVAGGDGCSAGWIAFKVESPSFSTLIEVVDQSWLRKRPPDLAFLSIDIPIGLFDPSELSNE
jgi:predicted RNase H-like nuclease